MSDTESRADRPDPALEETISAPERDDEGPAASSRGTVIGRYVVEGVIGQGGMGVVYAAHDPELQRPVALKLLRATGAGTDGDSTQAQRLLREARAMAQLSHPNVIGVYDVGRHEGDVFIAMERVDGESLRAWARERRPWQESLAVHLQAGEGLLAAHEAGLIHRDFKPENAILGRDGRVRVLDFGLVRGIGEPTSGRDHRAEDAPTPPAELGLSPTRTGDVVGTPLYMPPEQHRGERSDERSDQFSFCVALYEAVYGEHPFLDDDDGRRLAERVVRGERNPVPEDAEAPGWLRDALVRGLSRRPEDRFRSMRELLDALRPRPPRRRWWSAAAGVAVLVAAAIAVSWAGRPASRSADEATAVPGAGSTRKVTFNGAAAAPALSPDGERLFYASGGGVVLRELDSGAEREIYESSAVSRIRVSPDGTVVLRVVDRSPPRLVALHAETFEPRELGPQAAEFCVRSAYEGVGIGADRRTVITASLLTPWSQIRYPVDVPEEHVVDVACGPDWFAVVAQGRGGSAVYLVREDGSLPERLLEHSGLIDAVRWAPGAETLYVLRSAGPKEIVALPLSAAGEAGELFRVTGDVEAGDELAVSHDGRRIAYARAHETSDLFYFSTRPGGPPIRRLTDSATHKFGGAVSPDGTMAVFGVPGGDDEATLYTVPVAGGEVRAIARARFEMTDLAWSPDGRRIAFVAEHQGELVIWTVPASGGEPVPFAGTETSTGGFELTWAPAPFIVYQRPGNRNFHILDPETGEERPLLRDESKGNAYRPRIAPSGNSVAILRIGSGAEGLYRIDLEPYAERRITRDQKFPVAWTGDGEHVLGFHYSDRTIVRYDADGHGEPVVVGTPPDFGAARDVHPLPSRDEFVVNLVQSRGDIWMIERGAEAD